MLVSVGGLARFLPRCFRGGAKEDEEEGEEGEDGEEEEEEEEGEGEDGEEEGEEEVEASIHCMLIWSFFGCV